MSGSVDVEVALWCAEHRSESVTDVFRALEDIGTSPLLLVIGAIAALALVLVLRLRAGLVRVVLAIGVTFTVTAPFKEWIDRSRPPYDLAISHLSGPAMPSSHAMFTSSVVTAVLLAPWWASTRLHRIAIVVGVTGCVVSGAAMIYLGGHWLSDVLVGWALGTGIAFAVMKLRLPRRRVQTA